MALRTRALVFAQAAVPRWFSTGFLDQVKPSQRDIQPCAFGVLEQHELSVPVALIDLFQAVVLPDPMLDVDDIVPDLQIAEVGEERRDFRFLPLRTRGHRFRLIKQIARAENGQVRIGEHDAVGHVGFRERRGINLSGEVAGFVGIALAAARAASQPEADVVFREDVRQPLHFTCVWYREQNLATGAGKLLHFVEHRRNGPVKARSRLRQN